MKVSLKASIMIIVIPFFSCNFYGDINLGDGYYLWRDGQYREIVYRPLKNNDKGAYSLLHRNVYSYSVTDSTIFIKTLSFVDEDNDKEISEYYLIKKKKLYLEECINQKQIDSIINTIVISIEDSTSFYRILEKNKLTLK